MNISNIIRDISELNFAYVMPCVHKALSVSVHCTYLIKDYVNFIIFIYYICLLVKALRNVPITYGFENYEFL